MNKWILFAIGIVIGVILVLGFQYMMKPKGATAPDNASTYRIKTPCPPGQYCAGTLDPSGNCTGQCVTQNA